MGRVDKVRQWVIGGEKRKLQWYVRKRKDKVNLSEMRLNKKGQTALHLACKHQHYDIVKYLLRHRVDCLVQDKKGNVPLLLAAKAKKKGTQAYCNIALALLEACTDALYACNHKRQCAKQWLEHLGLSKEKEMPTRLKQEFTSYHEPDDRFFNTEWAEKLRDECEFEHFEHGGNYEQDFCNDYSSTTRESYDAWAERLTSEFRAKNRFGGVHFCSPKKRTKEPTWSATDQADFERKARKEEERRLECKKRKEVIKLKKQKNKYEAVCQYLFDKQNSKKITLLHLPQTETLVDTLLSDIQHDPLLVKSYLREQQVKWHPDKFVQKCGHRLCPHQREPILDRVKQLSQILNGFLENV